MLTKFAAGICVVLLSIQGVLAQGIPAGVGGPPPSDFEGTLNGVHVGSEANPIKIEIVPDGDPWLKVFTVDVGTGGIGPGLVIPVSEHFQIFPPADGGLPLPLTDWHEEVHTPYWTWLGGTLTIGSDPPIDGVTGGPQGAATNIWFDLPMGVTPGPDNPIDVFIHKELVYQGPPASTAPVVIEVSEYPTVPEPATMAMLAMGGAAMMLGGTRRRRVR